MKKDIWLWQFSGFCIVSFLGTILHFLYSWTNFLPISIISSVNESTWEHMKLMYTPMLLFAVVQYFYFKTYFKNFWCVKLIGIFLGLLSVPVLFYTLTGIFGVLSGFVNIAIFFISVFLAFLIEYLLFKNGDKNCKFNCLSLVILCLVLLTFFVFTFYPPKLPLFLDPLTNTYGINL